MRQKYRQSGRYGETVPLLLPPNLQALGTLPFSAQHFAELDAWLAEDGWPPDRMDVAMLEGYLAALLVWPVKLSPGAWLPQIWGIRGWKVAAKIATEEKYNRFVELVIGLLQDLERRLLASPPVQTAALSAGTPYLSGKYFVGAAWATGFMIALHENSAGLAMRSPGVRTAVENIAHHASRRSTEPSALAAVAMALQSALLVILAERSYGPVERVPLDKATLLRPAGTPAERRLRRSA
jgi:yecA family protein